LSLRWQWNLSTSLLDCGWYAIVGSCWMFNRLYKAAHREKVNWASQSDVITAGHRWALKQ
jgi:hypothetical protein